MFFWISSNWFFTFTSYWFSLFSGEEMAWFISFTSHTFTESFSFDNSLLNNSVISRILWYYSFPGELRDGEYCSFYNLSSIAV